MSKYELHLGDCLEVMKSIPDGSVDMILCDLPYGTTACKWDTVIPFEPLWAQYRRIAKRNAAIVLTASQPFTSALTMSNIKAFRYSWVWEKGKATGHLNAKKMPLKKHEDILVFCFGSTPYHAQGLISVKRKNSRPSQGVTKGEMYGKQRNDYGFSNAANYPKSVIFFSGEHKPVHPTQKPVALMEYMVRTYTNEGDIVLDNCMGSGTTGVACMNTGRRFIGIEMDAGYFQIARGRIMEAEAAAEQPATSG